MKPNKIKIFKEGKMYISYNPKLDLASCGYTKEKARKNLDEAVSLFLKGIREKKNFSVFQRFLGVNQCFL